MFYCRYGVTDPSIIGSLHTFIKWNQHPLTANSERWNGSWSIVACCEGKAVLEQIMLLFILSRTNMKMPKLGCWSSFDQELPLIEAID